MVVMFFFVYNANYNQVNKIYILFFINFTFAQIPPGMF